MSFKSLGRLVAVLLLLGAPQLGLAASQGPKVTTHDAQGNEVWASPSGGNLQVIDYNSRTPFPLGPTVVYNCAYMPSICNNLVRFSGTLPRLGLGLTGPQCPETNQPVWTGYNAKTGLASGPHVVEIHVVQRNGKTERRLGMSYQELTFDHDGSFTEATKWKYYGATISCDEFPLASTIEGGFAGDGKAGATGYCAPIGRSCDLAKTALTDQNWQGFIHSSLAHYFKSLRGHFDGAPFRTATADRIFKYKLRTVSDWNLPMQLG
ncbi:hypothetical protein LEL_11001 [Akanthomyces lecanii RCEF 1005]|uniref:Uncharacterized protein n=1 Tax=Akanthomyces lecanii RCEF 1005 TaxID=1081108 RepID=A0A167MWY3_CORDF|nr:hypothetical protein LEL_11001 [Akanthomyces lecanii RCEF 1005]